MSPVVVIDALGRTLERCAQLGEWLFWAEVDDAQVAGVVQVGVDAVNDLYRSLSGAQDRAADLWAPDGRTELDRLLVVDGDLYQRVEAIVIAGAALPPDQRSREPRAFTAHLLRCLSASARDDGQVLAGVPHDRPGRVLLTERQWVAYRRFAATLFTDPLERFAATGLTNQLSEGPAAAPPDRTGLEL